MADMEHHGPEVLRASHTDRDQVAELLRVAAGDGRLSAEELDERLERALTAKIYAELATLTADLPAAGTSTSHGVAATTGAAVANVAAKDVIRIDVGSGSTRRDGRWVVPKELDIKVTSGSVTLDLTQAVITRQDLRVAAEVHSGSLTLITRPGIVVDVDDVTVRSGGVKVHVPWGHDVPVLLRVSVEGEVRSGSIKARPPRRTFLQWLRRAPRPYALFHDHGSLGSDRQRRELT